MRCKRRRKEVGDNDYGVVMCKSKHITTVTLPGISDCKRADAHSNEALLKTPKVRIPNNYQLSKETIHHHFRSPWIPPHEPHVIEGLNGVVAM